MASRLPNHFESIFRPLIYSVSKVFITPPHKGCELIEGKKAVCIVVAYVHSMASNYNYNFSKYSGNKSMTITDANTNYRIKTLNHI